MRSPARFLLFSAEPSSAAVPFDADVVVILAVLLCAALSFVGLALFARCSSLRPAGGGTAAGAAAAAAVPPPNKGVKKKALLALPTLAFDSSVSAGGGGARLVDCAICLAEFADGEIVRVLPQCGHGFHRDCVDVWLRSRASCPSCRRSLAVSAPPLCEHCSKSSGAVAVEHDGGGSSAFSP
ncbi:putative E3 ubiquitin-protein ligase ATL44 [Curcuma longa]|uniref:putative E3 ubiquitin-protein ligase ATL44 n=1 Tax=Curcuma longa TaxID=136217 RepID=UPI003D9F9AAF